MRFGGSTIFQAPHYYGGSRPRLKLNASLKAFALMNRLHWWPVMLVLAFFVSACNGKTVRKNDPDDIERGLATIKKLYFNIQNENLNSAALMFGPEFEPNEPQAILQALTDTLGKLNDIDVVVSSSYYSAEKGTVDIEMRYEVACHYERGGSRDVVSLKGSSFETLHVMGFQCSLTGP